MNLTMQIEILNRTLDIAKGGLITYDTAVYQATQNYMLQYDIQAIGLTQDDINCIATAMVSWVKNSVRYYPENGLTYHDVKECLDVVRKLQFKLN